MSITIDQNLTGFGLQTSELQLVMCETSKSLHSARIGLRPASPAAMAQPAKRNLQTQFIEVLGTTLDHNLRGVTKNPHSDFVKFLSMCGLSRDLILFICKLKW